MDLIIQFNQLKDLQLATDRQKCVSCYIESTFIIMAPTILISHCRREYNSWNGHFEGRRRRVGKSQKGREDARRIKNNSYTLPSSNSATHGYNITKRFTYSYNQAFITERESRDHNTL